MRDSYLRRAACAGAVAVAVALVGCGGSSSSTSSSSGTSTSSAPTATTAPVADTGASSDATASAGDPAGPANSIGVPAKTIGVLELAGAEPTQKQMVDEFQRAASSLGWKLVVRDAAGDPNKMASGAQAFVQQKVDAFVGIAIPPTAIQPSLQAFKSSNTPVVNIAGTVQDPGKLITAQIRPSEAVNGAVIGQYMTDDLGPSGVMAMQNLDSQFGVSVRDNVVQTVAKDFGYPKIVADQQVDIANIVNDTLSLTRAQLAAHPNINAIFTPLDSPLPPIISVLKQKHLTNVKVFAVNTNAENSAALREYHNAAVVDAPYWYTSWMTADALLQFWAKHTPITTAEYNNKYEIPNQIVNYKNLPPKVANFPFPDLGATVYNDWKIEGYKVGTLPAPTVNVTK